MSDPAALGAFADLLKTMRASLNLPPIADGDLLRVLVGRDQLATPAQ
jgi:hypothetical protein